ncbi:necdin-like isoform X1 [Takifugu rubripes]|uniref:necdin-like isoform X1 n=1 Tax=Takifugu rubripes TaxID=31033 RepID=UPI00114603BB|nr:necdin-like isoform X1 [Takifugu rubripes]
MTQRGRSANPPRSSQAAVSPSIHPSIHRHSGSGRVQEDDDDSLFTQPTTSQVQRGLEKLTPAQVERKTAEVVQFILVKDQKKFPIRRADLIRVVLKEYKNIYPEVMKRAARTFEQVFGLRLMEIDPKNHLYILQNNLEPVGAASPVMKPCSSKTGLLWVILSVIFMKGGVVRESVIWNILKKLRVQPGEKHSEFGEVKKVVTEEFVRQSSISRTQRAGHSSTEKPRRPPHGPEPAARDEAVAPLLPQGTGRGTCVLLLLLTPLRCVCVSAHSATSRLQSHSNTVSICCLLNKVFTIAHTRCCYMSRGQLDTEPSGETRWLFRNRRTGQEDLNKNMTVHSSISENTSAVHPDVGANVSARGRRHSNTVSLATMFQMAGQLSTAYL